MFPYCDTALTGEDSGEGDDDFFHPEGLHASTRNRVTSGAGRMIHIQSQQLETNAVRLCIRVVDGFKIRRFVTPRVFPRATR